MARKSILTPEETASIRKQVRERRQLSLPGWDDVIHVSPDWMLSPRDLAARKYFRALRMVTSPSTQLSKSTTWLMTKVDDIQDGFVTLSVAARTVALGIPRLKPFALLAGRAADALNLGRIGSTIARSGKAAKRGAEGRLAQSPGYYMGRARNATSIARALPNVAETLQILQTSDQLTGIGISLGAIMGAPLAAITDAAARQAALPGWSDPRYLELTPEQRRDTMRAEALKAEPTARGRALATGLATLISVISPGTLILSAITETVGRLLPEDRRTAAEKARASALILEAMTGIGVAPDVFTPHEHLLFATAHHTALDYLSTLDLPISLAALGEPLLDTIITGDIPRHADTRFALSELGIDPDTPGPLPLEGSPLQVSLRDYQAELQETAPRVLAEWRDTLETDEEEAYAGALAAYAARATWRLLEGQDPQFEEIYTPPGRALITLFDYGIQIPEQFPPERTWDLLDQLGARWYAAGPYQPDPIQAATDLAECCNQLEHDLLRE